MVLEAEVFAITQRVAMELTTSEVEAAAMMIEIISGLMEAGTTWGGEIRGCRKWSRG